MSRIIDPRFPPVALDGNLLPVDHPQWVPPNPHNLPPASARPTRRSVLAGTTLISGAVPTSPSGSGFPGPAEPIFDAHHYANLIEGNIAVGNLISAKFLDMPATLRNILIFRNTSAAANVYLSFGRDASLNSVLRLTPNQIILLDAVVPQDDVYAFGDAAAATLSYAYSTIVYL